MDIDWGCRQGYIQNYVLISVKDGVIMEQGVQVGPLANRGSATAVAVTAEVSSDYESSESLIHDSLVIESDRDSQLFYPLADLATQSPDAHEAWIRVSDVIGSVIALILSLPLMLIVTVLIKVFSPGPILYKQKRVGRNGITFTLYKFRTMINNAEKHIGPVWAAKDDRRVTLIGRILRRTRLDELPQLFNILRGNMSLVGPRPERPYFVRRHKALQGVRLMVKPGLTGLAQIRSFYDLKPNHKIKYDYLYIQKRSLLLNLYILLRTIPVIFCKKGW